MPRWSGETGGQSDGMVEPGEPGRSGIQASTAAAHRPATSGSDHLSGRAEPAGQSAGSGSEERTVRAERVFPTDKVMPTERPGQTEDPGQTERTASVERDARPEGSSQAEKGVPAAHGNGTDVVANSVVSSPPPAATALFGDRLDQAQQYVEMLADTGVTHGLIGPREGERIWQRHVLNCAVLAELIEPNARVLDIGAGAGLPGIPLALARPDLEVVLLEPMARRVEWLRETVDRLDLPITVARGRAEEKGARRQWAGADVVTARAVAPLARLAEWALPFLRTGGRLLAVKGASASIEVTRDLAAVRGFGGAAPRVVQCGGAHVDPPTTVVVVERTAARFGARTPRQTRRRQG